METNQTISLFTNKVSNMESNQKGKFTPIYSSDGFITPREECTQERMQAWGTPDNGDVTTERVFAMLEMNKNMINKYQSIKKDQTTFSSVSPPRLNKKLETSSSQVNFHFGLIFRVL